MQKNGKHLDFEINLIPCIDLLSVCICFLLLTAVWVSVGSMNVKQAIGGQSVAETEKKPVLWVAMGAGGELNLKIQDSAKVPAKLANLKVAGIDGQLNTANLRTALLKPQANSAYEDIIGLMDQFKRKGLVDLGVVPL
jgi:biopolymer transport protein TolR